MKKIVLVCVSAMFFTFHLLPFTSLRAQGFDWHRLNVTIDYSTQSPAFLSLSMLQGRSGLFAGHPASSLNIGVGYRLWGHFEAGLYANYSGASATSGTGKRDLGNGQTLQTVYFEDGSAFGWGALVQVHLVPFKYRHEIGVDMSARLGFDFSGVEADNFWGGIGWNFWISKHVSLTFGVDLGSFRYGRMENALNGSNMWGGRLTLGAQVEL